MEKMNIHQRAIDIFNRRVNPDISQGGGGGSSDAVQYIPQELTEAQQIQARKNQGLYWSKESSATWDGDTAGLDSIMGMWYKVPAFESVTLDSVTRIERFDGEVIEIITAEDLSEMFGLDPGVFIMESEYQSVVTLTQDADMDIGGSGTPEHYTKGCYAMCTGETYVSKIIFENISKIPSKFINIDMPKAVGQKGDGYESVIFNDYYENEASGEMSFVEGSVNHSEADYSHMEGRRNTNSSTAVASHVEGEDNDANGQAAHAEGSGSKANGKASHAEGGNTTARSDYSHAEGSSTTASQSCAHAEGYYTQATGSNSHAEGQSSEAWGTAAHAEGRGCKAKQPESHAEGNGTEADGQAAHAEGLETVASDAYSHAEGYKSKASGLASHAEGASEASAQYAHAEGENTLAKFNNSHAEGCGTITTNANQHACGKYNYADTPGWSDAYFVVGNGTNENSRHDAFIVNAEGGIVVPASDDANVYMEIRVKKDGTIVVSKYWEPQQ